MSSFISARNSERWGRSTMLCRLQYDRGCGTDGFDNDNNNRIHGLVCIQSPVAWHWFCRVGAAHNWNIWDYSVTGTNVAFIHKNRTKRISYPPLIPFVDFACTNVFVWVRHSRSCSCRTGSRLKRFAWAFLTAFSLALLFGSSSIFNRY